MKPSLRKHGLRTESDLACAIDPVTAIIPESSPRSSAARFEKKFSVAISALVTVVAIFGWFYLIKISFQAFVSSL
jgi:hypothetical protein